jgi:PST family polysaccharide transporter
VAPTTTSETKAATSPEEPTYGQILKSTSILGGAQGLNYLIAMGRTKIVAVLLGPSGVGLVSLYQSLISVIGTVAALGISSSGVRDVAEAVGAGDDDRIARAAWILRRVSWITGLIAWLLVAAFSWPLSQWVFDSHDRAVGLAILGASLLFTLVSGGQMACLEGLRRIGDIARIQVLSMIVSTVVAIGLYAWLHERGIVPVMLVSAVISCAFSGWYSSRVPLKEVRLDWRQMWLGSKRMIHLGLAFMWSAVLGTAVAFGIRMLIVRESGIEANGIYQSAWAISGMFAGFILAAMGTDFYPRLTAAAYDTERMNRMVNEQTEVGILLGMPGLLGTMVFAPLLMKLLYTVKFLAGAELLPWFVLGVFLKTISWPMGFILLAKGETRWFAGMETLCNLIHFIFSAILLKKFGLVGVSGAFILMYVFYGVAMLFLTKAISSFKWDREVLFLMLVSTVLIFASLAVAKWTTGWVEILSGCILVGTSLLISFRGVVFRLGAEHRLVKLILKMPIFKIISRLPR